MSIHARRFRSFCGPYCWVAVDVSILFTGFQKDFPSVGDYEAGAGLQESKGVESRGFFMLEFWHVDSGLCMAQENLNLHEPTWTNGCFIFRHSSAMLFSFLQPLGLRDVWIASHAFLGCLACRSQKYTVGQWVTHYALNETKVPPTTPLQFTCIMMRLRF